MAGKAGSVAGFAAAAMPRMTTSQPTKTVRLGFLAPLSGPVSAWGTPGRDGCMIWADRVNAAGGIQIGNHRYRVEIVSEDSRYDPDLALKGAKKLVLEDEVKFIMMLGGDTYPAVQTFFNHHKMLVSTLLPSDLSPDTPYLIAPCEVHPIYNVTGVEWLQENRPHLKKAAICAQDDSLGLPSIATYRAAFKAAGIDLVEQVLFPSSAADFSGIVSKLMASGPDILCWDTCYEPFVHALTEEAFCQGFKGQLLSCTCDNYQQLIQKTSRQFMEGFVFQFPDFDDPALNGPGVNFTRPNDFYEEFNRRYPGSWSAVSWEYAAILDLWKAAVESAGNLEPVSVLAAMRAGGRGKHVFGDARWWGKRFFGIDHALVGNWPVVVIRNGKAMVAEFKSIPEWWDRHGELLTEEMRELGQMWDQRAQFLKTAG
ncbi:MAG: ABC transporter substrate-binding protein [Kiloniellales bacterium]|nr:ABC transporter substrate-binding protein [Kiloniellales bacterium]